MMRRMDVTALPPALAVSVLTHVPVHDRMRCREVCRAWRVMLRLPGLFEVLDFSAVPLHLLSASLVRAASACAAGGVRELRAWRCIGLYGRRGRRNGQPPAVSLPLLHEIIAANAGSLRRVHVADMQPRIYEAQLPGVHAHLENLTAAELEELARALPGVVLEASLTSDCAETVLRLLSGTPPFEQLRVQKLTYNCREREAAALASLTVLAEGMTAHPTLRSLAITAPLGDEDALDAVCEGIAACPDLRLLHFEECQLDAGCLQSLALMLEGCDALEELAIMPGAEYASFLPSDYRPAEHEAEGLVVLCAALRSRPRLRRLELSTLNIDDSAEAMATLLGALEGHPSLEELVLEHLSRVFEQVVSDALVGLLTADDSALTALTLSGCGMTDEMAQPIFRALAGNTRLRKLDWSEEPIDVDYEAFHFCDDSLVRDELLPALRVNTTLRSLTLPGGSELAVEAQMLVQGRAAREAAAARRR
jgi:hypothetical protein